MTNPKPVCDYMPSIAKIAEHFGVGVWDVKVAHDSWCPIIQGDGSKPCRPDFYMFGRKVKP